MIRFPSIEQYRSVAKNVSAEESTHAVIRFHGSTKLHGTNAGVGFGSSGLWVQSRNNIISPQSDNAGFALFVEKNRLFFETLLQSLRTDDTVCIFGEWCGKGIQKSVAIAELEPRFVIFGAVRVGMMYQDISDPDTDCVWLDNKDVLSRLLETRAGMQDQSLVFHIDEFPSWDIDIDFSAPPESIQTLLLRITSDVERECPVAKYFGVSGTGEGVVWVGQYKGKILRFKVKGTQHSVVQTKSIVAMEKVDSVAKFIQYAVTVNRMEQGYDELFTKQSRSPSMKLIGEFIKWVHADVLKEESDTLCANGLSVKDVSKDISDIARTWFTQRLMLDV